MFFSGVIGSVAPYGAGNWPGFEERRTALIPTTVLERVIGKVRYAAKENDPILAVGGLLPGVTKFGPPVDTTISIEIPQQGAQFAPLHPKPVSTDVKKQEVDTMQRAFLWIMASVVVWTMAACETASAQPFAYVLNSNSGSVSVIDVASKAVVSTIAVGGFPEGMSITPDGAFVYVANGNFNSVIVIDTATNTIVATIPVGNTPWAIAFTPDGAFAYVVNQGDESVSVVHTGSKTVVATIPSVGTRPLRIAITPDGNFAYVADFGTSSVFVIDTASNTVVKIIPGLSFQPLGIAFTPDGTFAYVATVNSNRVYVINAATNSVVQVIGVGAAPNGLAVTPDGAFVYVAHQL